MNVYLKVSIGFETNIWKWIRIQQITEESLKKDFQMLKVKEQQFKTRKYFANKMYIKRGFIEIELSGQKNVQFINMFKGELELFKINKVYK